ncbi:MAG: aminotransferase class I/II-fold pyridoxal phosphate-dependent enzyme [Kiritimatiellae bacterium]|nr:aminotransferase class I/II-fold pyridoxal phosphate-dependent enzyme [Kiritimatiellia bacterium]
MNAIRIRPAIAAMTGYTPGEQPREPDIIKLNTNENPYPPSPAVVRALREFDVASLRRYPEPMCDALRARIAELHRVRAEQVLVGNGSDELLALCVRALVPRNAAIGWFEPSYSLYPVLAAMEELRAVPTELGPDFEWREPVVDDVALFLLTHPNAPTGCTYPAEAIEGFRARFSGILAVDEAYVDFATRDLMGMVGKDDRTLVFRSLSKSFSLAGLRLGYVVGPPDLIRAMATVKDSYNVDRLAAALGQAALGDLEWMRQNVRRIRATRERVRARLHELGCRVWPSETNFLWFRPAGRPAAEVMAELRAARILVRYFPGRRTGECLRVTIGTDPEMDTFLGAMERILCAGKG